MVSSGLLRRVARVRTTRRNNPEDTILKRLHRFTETKATLSVDIVRVELNQILHIIYS
jgi:hypothetical protein